MKGEDRYLVFTFLYPHKLARPPSQPSYYSLNLVC